MGLTYGALGNHKEALRYQLEALELCEKLLGQEHPDVATSLNNVGSTYGELGNHNEALRYQLEALELRKKLLGQEHPDVATSLNNVGSTYGELGNHNEALRYKLEALELRKKLLGQEHPDVATSLNNVGLTYGDLGNHNEALLHLSQALEIQKKILTSDHPRITATCNNLAFIRNSVDIKKLQEWSAVYLSKAKSLHKLKEEGAPYTAEYVIEAYDRALAFEPENIEALKGKAQITSGYENYVEKETTVLGEEISYHSFL